MNKFWLVPVINRKDILKMRQKQQFQFNYLQKKVQTNITNIVIVSSIVLKDNDFIQAHIQEITGKHCETVYKFPKNINTETLYIILVFYKNIYPYQYPKYYIIWQIEQLASSEQIHHSLDKNKIIIMKNASFIFEISMKNYISTEVYNHHIDKNKILYNPLPFYDYPIENECNDKTLDCIFIGTYNERRNNILNHISNELEEKGMKLHIYFGLFNTEKTDMLKKAKFILNIHYYENAALETHRINEALYYNCITISEDVIDDEETKELYSDCVIYNPIIKENQENISSWVDCIFNNLQDDEYKKKIDNLHIHKNTLSNDYNLRIRKNLEKCDKLRIVNTLKSDITMRKDIGVVITTHGNNGIYVRQCLECFLRNTPNAYIVFFVNESSDPKILSIEKDYPNIHYIYNEDQNLSGGLTGTWNKGIDICIQNNCNIVILSNDDIFFDDSIKYIINEAFNCNEDELKYFGPVTNNPGPSIYNKKTQYSKSSIYKLPYVCKINNNLLNINGFFMVMPVHVLKKNMYDENHYFDPKKPFCGNETEWFIRSKKINCIPMIVPKTFIYHYKLKSWNNNILNDTCIFTINFGNYEKNVINLKNNSNIDNIYFTDNYSLRKGSHIYDCIMNDIYFLYIDTSKYNSNNWWPNCKHAQRIIKTSPHEYLPFHYKKSLYIDGNIFLRKPIFKLDIDNYLKNYDIVCFIHPDPNINNRHSIEIEAKLVERFRLEKKSNIDKILNIQKQNNFLDDIGLTETCILIRKHKNIIHFSQEWTKMVKMCIRDQISFDYLLWKYKINYERKSIQERQALIYKQRHKNPLNRIF